MPWLGYFDLIDRADCFVFYNDVQYDRSWRSRNRIRSAKKEGWSWITAPVILEDGLHTMLDQAKICYKKEGLQKVWNQIHENYRKAPFYNQYKGDIQDILLTKQHGKLVDLNKDIIEWICDILSIETKIVISSEYELKETERNNRLIEVCQTVGADKWLANSACRNYLDVPLFEKAGIEVIYQDYVHPVYEQQYEPFVSHMSIIDLLFNCGEESGKILRSTQSAGEA